MLASFKPQESFLMLLEGNIVRVRDGVPNWMAEYTTGAYYYYYNKNNNNYYYCYYYYCYREMDRNTDRDIEMKRKVWYS